MTGANRLMNMMQFYKNVSLMGGFFLLYVTGAGKYAIAIPPLPVISVHGR